MKKLIPTAIIAIVILIWLERDKAGFVKPESPDWVIYTQSIREYMYYRTIAVLNNDIQILWDRYPDLKKNMDIEKNINAEKFEVEILNQDQGFQLIDANYDIEGYEKIKVKKVKDDEVIVLVHGTITYLSNDFNETGGEHLIKVFLKHIDNKWTVVKTDEYNTYEYKKWLKNK